MNTKSKSPLRQPTLEPLETRIAPASVAEGVFRSVTAGGSLLLKAGEGLATSDVGGAYLLFVESGQAMVFTSDFNGDQRVDFNEITGIAAGDGLSLIAFGDINGDIVTNLNPNGTLTDSDNDSLNGRDGNVLLNSRINKIEMRALTTADLADPSELSDRLAYTTFSIRGNVLAGKGIGLEDGTGGIIFDLSNLSAVQSKYGGRLGFTYPTDIEVQLGSIVTGSATSGLTFTFGSYFFYDGVLPDPDPAGFNGVLTDFRPPSGQNGGDVIGVRGILNGQLNTTLKINLDSIVTGDGGFGGRGGNISNVVIGRDNVGGYILDAGNGGSGLNGGAGGSIIDCQDFGSVTGLVQIMSGDGGIGLTGRGGDAGGIKLGTMNLAADLRVLGGTGGDGFSGGGNGASITDLQLLPVDLEVPVGLSIIGSARSPGDIGKETPIDLNGDGVGDALYSVSGPDLVVALLGDGLGSFYDRMVLPGATSPSAITAGDFNGDGLTDVAVGVGGFSTLSEVKVYLSQVDPLTGDFSFSPGVRTVLPYTGAAKKGPTPITDLVSGDFDGDGILDVGLAATATQTDPVDPTKTVQSSQVYMLLGFGNGSFAGDFGPLASPVDVAYSTGKVEGDLLLKATTFDGTKDILLVGLTGKKEIRALEYNAGTGVGLFDTISLGSVDTNREVGPDKISSTEATLQDFTVLDANGDGVADLVVLAAEPTGFLITFEGDVLGPPYFVKQSGSGDNAGFDLVSDGPLGDSADLKAIVSADADGDGNLDDISLYDLAADAVPKVYELKFSGGLATDLTGADLLQTVLFVPTDDADGRGNVPLGIDVYFSDATNPAVVDYGILSPVEGNNAFASVQFRGDVASQVVAYVDFNVILQAGDGGDSSTGVGGAGGTIGGTPVSGTVNEPVAPIYLELPNADNIFNALFQIQSGNGGSGLTGGGNAGDIIGVGLRAGEDTGLIATSAVLIGGDGGNGTIGRGGNGGSLSGNSMIRAFDLFAGNGGSGATGGNGGSVIGNGLDDYYDANVGAILVVTGNGGNGVKRGGDGGNISGFDVELPAFIGTAGGGLFYATGNGGNSLSGAGGNGGSVIDSGPSLGVNTLVNLVSVTAGNGGNGFSGGNGGSIVNFVNSPSIQVVPAEFALLAGNAGKGTRGKGGDGGSISGSSISGVGYGDNYLFSRVIAGNGGSSSGANGGNGGSVTGDGISTGKFTAQSAALAIVAGAGGDGLKQGGSGGKVASVQGNASANEKLLVIAGAGGSATASLPFTHSDPLANPALDNLRSFGGANGKGGNGGDISGFVQPSNLATRVDLIAGNGGSTLNYGTPIDDKSNVGKGGSITNTTITGHIGNPDASVAIKAYNDLVGDYRADVPLSQFVETSLRSILPLGGDTLTDADGLVGLVAGAAGRLLNNQPASTGVNGSVAGLSVSASSFIMSMVAGNVDQIAAINKISGIVISGGGVPVPSRLGTDKAAPALPPPAAALGMFDYYDSNGNVVQQAIQPSLQAGWGLRDGAIFGREITGISGTRVFDLP